MSSPDAEPAMLILSRAIYAKRQDDSFYPGTVESKLPDGSYFVDFADGGKEKVEESEITWLGFWGLPPWMWPRNPVIQTTDPPANLQILEEQFRSKYTIKEDAANSVSFRSLFRESGESTKRLNRFSKLDGASINAHEYRPSKMNRYSQSAISPHVSPSQTSVNQTRTSVLRICSKGGLRQEDSKSEKEFSSTENKIQSPVTCVNLTSAGNVQGNFQDFRLSFDSTLSNSDNEKDLNFEEHKAVLQNVNSDSSIKKRKLSYEECLLKEKYTRSDHIETKRRNSSPFQKHYPTSPSLPSFVSPHFQDYGHHAFGLSMYDSTSPQMPSSFRLQTRARTRSENKKCRKVYGIENRDIWCTQCKWKKACTRFACLEKGDRTGLMYLSDYDRVHYPV